MVSCTFLLEVTDRHFKIQSFFLDNIYFLLVQHMSSRDHLSMYIM